MKTNPLGDIRAENDHEMLDKVFYETPDYLSILEEHKRRIVVGRRGTGKSAMFYKLQSHWHAEPKTVQIELTPVGHGCDRLASDHSAFRNKTLLPPSSL